MKGTRHLDLGCGVFARNPYQSTELWGCDLVDLREQTGTNDFNFVCADISQPPLPFEDNFFSSVSAFDLIEHIPRSVYINGNLHLPFISLMNEVFRILEPQGVFFASTPAFPHPAAFQDPTHVNIITDETHNYFCGSAPYARRYGFTGSFSVHKVKRDTPKNLHDQKSSNLRKWYRNLEYKFFKGGVSHITWELVAKK
jgi:SAM-dependent methyltransferase